VKKFDMRMW